MANTVNVAIITTANTFNHWRIRDNLVANDVNEIVRGNFTKPAGNVTIAEGYMRIANSIGGVVLDVADGTNIDGTLTVFNVELDNSSNHLYVDAGDIKIRRMGANDKMVVNTNTVFYGANVTIANAANGILNVNTQTVTINTGNMTLSNTESNGAVFNIYPRVYLFANANVTGTLNVTNNVSAYNLAVVSNTSTGNLVVRNVANVDNANITTAYITSLTVTNPIAAPASTDDAGYIVRVNQTTDGDGYFRVKRSAASGNAELYWDDVYTNSWKFLVNGTPADLVAGNLSATMRGSADYLEVNGSTSGPVAVNVASSNWFKYTLTGNTTFRFEHCPTDGSAITFTLILIQDGTGGRAVSWANTIYWTGGLIPPATTTLNARDLWTFSSIDGGATYIGTLSVKDYR